MPPAAHAVLQSDARTGPEWRAPAVETMRRAIEGAARYTPGMAKGTRITLTKSEAETATGARLLDLILDMCHDGQLDFREIETLHAVLCHDTSRIAAIQYLRTITAAAVEDGAIDDMEAYRLKLAFQRVVPKQIRGIVSTHLEGIGLPANDDYDTEPAWVHDDATVRQLEYIAALGGTASPKMTKGEAAELIDQLLERRPPTGRQLMVLRFFDRLDLANATRDDVSLWLDTLYGSDGRYERAWERFKRATNHDPYGRDPKIVPVGAFREFMEPQRGMLARAIDGLLKLIRRRPN